MSAVGGALLSPNPESKDLNAIVFGVAGALVGGAACAFLFKDPKPNTKDFNLREKELGLEEDTKLYAIPPTSKLPAFVKERLAPVVIEESEESDSVSEDGTLHEPHRTYRIQKPAELFSRPKKIQQVGP